MGNRHGNSRRKARENTYNYSDNRRDDYSIHKNGTNGSLNRRQYPSTSLTNYSQHSNGYGQSNIITTNKLIYVANYDFNGTASTGELSFHKGDRLEILDRYS